MIEGVTITGADDNVDPHELLSLTTEFPFVEWGILFSYDREGTPRYPTPVWQQWLCETFAGTFLGGNALSLHVCGSAARQLRLPTPLLPQRALNFTRVQINGYAPGEVSGLRRIANLHSTAFILQCRSESDLQQMSNDAAQIADASVLFDPSGGRGFEPFAWPATPSGCHLGFAGGINPDNVRDVIAAIGPRDDYWIDMESGVRTDNRFDMAKVRRVLELVAALQSAACPERTQ